MDEITMKLEQIHDLLQYINVNDTQKSEIRALISIIDDSLSETD